MKARKQLDPNDFLPLHPLEFQILLALAECSAHAYAVVCAIEEQQPEGKPILPTNMYRRIWRLVSNGLVEEVQGENADATRPRKHLAITSLGRRVAAAEATRLRSLLLHAEQVGVRPQGGGR
jgi:DNA-binding PadR family transcriptional regulator